MANNNNNITTQNDDLGRIVLFNSSGLPKTRCHMIKSDVLSKLKPLVLLLNETKLNSEDDHKNLEDRLDLSKQGYKFKTKSKSGKNPGGIYIFNSNTVNNKFNKFSS